MEGGCLAFVTNCFFYIVVPLSLPVHSESFCDFMPHQHLARLVLWTLAILKSCGDCLQL